MMSDSVLLGLNATNHVSVHCNILIRTALSHSAEARRSSTMIKGPVSSANNRIQEPNSYKKQKKSIGPV